MHMPKIIHAIMMAAIIGSFGFFGIFTAKVHAYTIDDDTMVHQKTNHGGSWGEWKDKVGNSNFEVYGIDVTASKNGLTFDLYTNFSGEYQVGSAWVYLADLALDHLPPALGLGAGPEAHLLGSLPAGVPGLDLHGPCSRGAGLAKGGIFSRRETLRQDPSFPPSRFSRRSDPSPRARR